MFSKYFISTLVFIIVSLIVLFQGEIKEGFADRPMVQDEKWDSEGSLSPDVYKHLPKDGLVPKPYFSAWQGNGGQFISVETDPFTDKYGNAIAHVDRKLGYDTAQVYKSPAPKAVSPIPNARMMRGHTGGIKESYTPVNSFSRDPEFNGVQIEAARNMQPLTGGPPRFNNNQSPHFNLTYPIDNAKYAVDPAHPIVNYGCGDTYAADGQLQKMSLDTRENYDDGGMTGGVPQNMMSLGGQPAQPVVIDRVGMPALMVNSKSRLQLGGVDRIRGDIDIVPSLYMSDGCGKGAYKEREYSKWFQVAVKPSRDLVSGYIPQHIIRGAEFGAKAAASGIDPQLLASRINNTSTDAAILNYQDPSNRYMPGMPSFGPSENSQSVEGFNMRQRERFGMRRQRENFTMGQGENFGTMGRSNPTDVRYGTDVVVGSYGI